ncbi:hypothetical protein ACFY2G_04290 [Streptomyces collinus]|uniref:hypothetical protein n=1 Tax=Streptomyces collinus TaxID=42684 RepID=UPI00367A9CDD
MTNPSNPPVGSAAAAHAQRIRERDARKAKEKGGQADGRQTFEVYADRVRAVARADEEMRRQVEESGRRARAEREAADAAEVEDAEEGAEETEGQVVDLRNNPERRSTKAAHRASVDQAYARVAREAQGYIA